MTPLQWKLIGGGVLAMIAGIFIASWLSRGAEIERLAEWQQTVVLATTAATVEPDKKGIRKVLEPSQVPAAIAALKRSADNAESTLASIDQAALKDKAIERKLDEQLSLLLADQDQRAKGSAATIKDLLKRAATGDREKDCAVMESDSEAAWNGWRK
jgi:hypothetical protein